jgi:hypothetical protein
MSSNIKIPIQKNEEEERLIPRCTASTSYSSSGYANSNNPYTGYNNNIGNMSCSLNTTSLSNNQSQILHSPKPLIRTNSMASSSATASSAILFAASKINQPNKPIPRTKTNNRSLGIYLLIYLCIYLLLYQSINLSITLSIYLSMYLSINLSINLSIYVSIY